MEFFNLPDGDNRRPHQVALDWLIEQNLKPGDLVSITNLDAALCLVDPDSIGGGRKVIQDWTLARLAEFVKLREEYEIETGELLIETYGGAYLVCPREEVAERLMDDFFTKLLRQCQKTAKRLVRATKDGASEAELMRRNTAVEKVSGVKAFLSRERRPRLA